MVTNSITGIKLVMIMTILLNDGRHVSAHSNFVLFSL